jgi:KTSC domain-containing protein
MNFTRVESSTLATVGYDQDHELLQLEFCSRALYQYFAVPAAVHEALLAAASKGSYFNQAIRGRYRFGRVAKLWRPGDALDAVLCESARGAAWRAR